MLKCNNDIFSMDTIRGCQYLDLYEQSHLYYVLPFTLSLLSSISNESLYSNDWLFDRNSLYSNGWFYNKDPFTVCMNLLFIISTN